MCCVLFAKFRLHAIVIMHPPNWDVGFKIEVVIRKMAITTIQSKRSDAVSEIPYCSCAYTHCSGNGSAEAPIVNRRCQWQWLLVPNQLDENIWYSIPHDYNVTQNVSMQPFDAGVCIGMDWFCIKLIIKLCWATFGINPAASSPLLMMSLLMIKLLSQWCELSMTGCIDENVASLKLSMWICVYPWAIDPIVCIWHIILTAIVP